jgi:phospholipid-translocating ATPase
MPEVKDGKIIYQAQSPDENALVSAARTFGFVFIGRSQNSVTARLQKKEEKYELLNILDFNNDRKRMSVSIFKNRLIDLLISLSLIDYRTKRWKNNIIL